MYMIALAAKALYILNAELRQLLLQLVSVLQAVPNDPGANDCGAEPHE